MILSTFLRASPEDYLECIDLLFADWRSGELLRKLQAGRDFVLSALTEDSVVNQTCQLMI